MTLNNYQPGQSPAEDNPMPVKLINKDTGNDVGLENPLPVEIPSALTAFGELSVAENQPYIQAVAAYNFLPANFRAFTSGTGSTDVANGLFQVSTGTGVGGYGAIQSFRAINYKAGQGGLARFTGIFESNVANSWQGVGLLSIKDELSFGYNGTQFGIWHRYRGEAEVRTITVTGATGGGGETLALTLNGVQYDIPLTSGTVQHNAYEIANWLENNQSVWNADQLDDTVIISALSDGAKSGTYTYGGSTSTGTIVQSNAGVTKTSDFIAQDDWNGTMWTGFDPSKGNVYQIQYQYLGFGDIKFYIENPETGVFQLVHTIKFANTSLLPSIANPSLRIGMYCVSLGSTTNLNVYSASLAAFTQGVKEATRNPRGAKNTQSISSTTDFQNILTIRNRRTYNNIINQVEVEPLLLVISSESTKNVEIEVRASTDFGVEQNFVAAGNNLVVDVDTTLATIAGGRLLTAVTIAPGGQEPINLKDLQIRLPPTLKFAISAKRTGGSTAPVTAALTWYEDV